MGFLDEPKHRAEGVADKVQDIPGADKLGDLADAAKEKLADMPGGDKVTDLIDKVTGGDTPAE